MANSRKGKHKVEFWLTPEDHAALVEGLKAAGKFIPYQRGLSSGVGGSVKEFVLNEFGAGYKDAHEEQSEAFKDKVPKRGT